MIGGAPAANYKPSFHMPMIPLPPAGTPDPVAYYRTLNSTARVVVSGAANQGLDILLFDVAHNPVYAVSGGYVTFFPPGAPLPTLNQEPSPGTGTLMLATWAADIGELKRVAPAGVPPWIFVFYGNVDPQSIRDNLLPVVGKLTQSFLETSWQVNHPGPISVPRGDLDNDFIDRLLRTEVTLFVEGGQQLGAASRVDPADRSSDTNLIFHFLDTGDGYLSPLAHLRDMPQYADPNWQGHPLITGTESFAIPVNIYLEFQVWEAATNSYVHLPSGIAIDLMDYDPVGGDDVLLTETTDAQGRVHFTSADIHVIEEPEPDIYFRLNLNGRSHAGHTLPQAWSTKGWLATDGSLGYYENFNGTQLGDAAKPLVFRVGLDWHLRLIYEDKRRPVTAGTIDVNDRSASVTGSGTAFDSFHKGWTLRVAGEPAGYVIDNVLSATSVALKQPYVGTSKRGQPFTVDPPAPKGVLVGIITGTPQVPGPPTEQQLRTDENGEVHGVIFDVEAEETIYFRVNFEMEDATINLPRVSVAMVNPASPEGNEEGWPTYYLDPDQSYFPDNQ